MASDRIVLSLEDFSHSIHFASKSSTDEKQWGIKEASRARQMATMTACLYLNIATFGMSAVLGVIFVDFIAYFDSSRSKPALIESLYYGLSFGKILLIEIEIELIVCKINVFSKKQFKVERIVCLKCFSFLVLVFLYLLILYV